PEAATIHVLPQLWFRNTWSWSSNAQKPGLSAANGNSISVKHPELGNALLFCEGNPAFLFCENETNVRRLYGQTAIQGFFKDAFHEFVIAGNKQAVNPRGTGTKAAALYRLSVAAGESACVRLRLVAADVRRQRLVGKNGSNESASSPRRLQPFTDFDELFEQR